MNLPPETPNVSAEEKLQRTFRKIEILPLPESMLVNTEILRRYGQELIITPKGDPDSEFIIVRYSPAGPVLIRFDQDDSKVSEPIPAGDDFLSLCDGEADGPAVSFCAWGDFVMIGTEAGTYDFQIVQGSYDDDFKTQSPKISTARENIRQALAAAGPTPAMLSFENMDLDHKTDDGLQRERPPMFQLIAKAWRVHMLRMETTHGGRVPEPVDRQT